VALFVALAASAILLAGIATVRRARERRVRRRLAGLLHELRAAPRPGRLEEALRRALEDSELQVGYRLPERDHLVDSNGHALDIRGRRQVTTPIVRGDTTIAVVIHNPRLLHSSSLEEAIGDAARLAIDNERLRVRALAQLVDLQDSRARIVRRGDEARRVIERDLHDGAQQRLLSVLFELRVALGEARAAGDDSAARVFAAAESDAVAALDELRVIAHGIYPAVLHDGGLRPALESLADVASLPIELACVTPRRYAREVEAAAYATVVDEIRDAARRSATYVRVEVFERSMTLVVDVEDDGSPIERDFGRVRDRVGALGGTVRTRASGVRGELPCA